jgi:hypothetical protein
MSEETNKNDKKELTKDEAKAILTEEISVLELELVHAKLCADIQEQSTRRVSLLVQEANIMGVKNKQEEEGELIPKDKASNSEDSKKHQEGSDSDIDKKE